MHGPLYPRPVADITHASQPFRPRLSFASRLILRLIAYADELREMPAGARCVVTSLMAHESLLPVQRCLAVSSLFA